MTIATAELLRQHLIDPEICIRCNTCEETCPVGAITHDARNYVVRADTCNECLACVAPCPTGAIDNWRTMRRADAYSIEQQFTWDILPTANELAANLTPTELTAIEVAAAELPAIERAPLAPGSGHESGSLNSSASPATGAAGLPEQSLAGAAIAGALVAPKSASRPQVNLYTARNPLRATVTGNFRVTGAECDSDTHHIVFDFGSMALPVLEGQSIGVIVPGLDASGRPHPARQYSVASPRDGERAGYNNVALTVKRVTTGHDGQAVRGLCSNYLCDLNKGDTVQVIGPFGKTFLMPDDPASNLLMICTGTGAAPMRAMTERRRRQRGAGGNADRQADQEGAPTGRLLLFFGARTQQELPYFGPLMNLPHDFIDVNLALSRAPDVPRRYVQDAMSERADDIAALLGDERTHIYVCGVRGMEGGALDALRAAAARRALHWESVHASLVRDGRLHLETY